MKIKNTFQYCLMYIQKYSRKWLVMPRMRKALHQKNFSVVSSNCNGGVLCSDLGVGFNSPTVNAWFYPDEYLRMVSNLREYMAYDLIEVSDDTVPYPVGELNGDVRIYFQHYHSFEEAKAAWDRRKARMNYDNVFLMFTDRNGCTDDQLKRFDSLPYKNKIAFTCKPHPELKSCVWCEEFIDQDEVPILTLYRNWRGERLYDRYFDFVGWLNGKA